MLTKENAKSIVIEGYINILKRWPDENGMEHYSTRLISGEIDKEKFCNILIDSEEYKSRFDLSVHNINIPADIKSTENIEKADKFPDTKGEEKIDKHIEKKDIEKVDKSPDTKGEEKTNKVNNGSSKKSADSYVNKSKNI